MSLYLLLHFHMKYFIWCMYFLIIFLNITFSASWKTYSGTTAEQVLDRVVDNSKTENIIESQFDNVINKGTFGQDKKISGTLDSIRDNISFYLNWILFLGLTGATILIVYNGFLLVFTPVAGDQLEKVKKRLLNIVVGVVVMTGFYFIIKVSLSVMNMILE